MRLLIISKNLLDQKDAQSQQSLAFIEALQKICEHIDVITAETTGQERGCLKYLEEENVNIYALPAQWVTVGIKLIDKIKRKLHRNLMAILATKWARQASVVANNLNEKYNYSAVITIGLPVESHIAGIRLRDRSKWIAHFSDPWPESIMPKPYSDYSIPVLSKLQKINVQRIIAQANFIGFTCKQSRDLFANYYDFKLEKTFIVPHVAPDPLQPIRRKDGNFIITHAGSLSRERVFSEFFYAIKKLPRESNVIFQFIGGVHNSAKRLIGELGIEDRFVFAGQISKAEALLRMRQSDALLLIEAKMDAYPFLPSKLADYSALGLPIYAITGEKSASAIMLNACESGLVSSYGTDDILNALQKIAKMSSFGGANMIYENFSKNKTQEAIEDVVCMLAKRSPEFCGKKY